MAKNRYRLKPEIPLSWEAIVSGILGGATESTTSNPTTLNQGDAQHG